MADDTGVLRETTEPTEWEAGRMEPGTTLVIFAPFFHRDDERLTYADAFRPSCGSGSRRRTGGR